MNKILLGLSLLFLSSCATVQIPSYIKADHPYSKKMYGDYNTIVNVVRNAVIKNGWKIKTVTNPSIYERAEEGNDNNDVLLFTEVKEHSKIAYTSYTHLNVFIRAIAEGAMVEIRYEKVTPVLKRFRSTKNAKLADKILLDIEQELLETK